MEKLDSLLSSKKFTEPPEISHIKRYIQKRFDLPVSVSMQTQSLVITVGSAAFAGTLRMHLTELQKLAQTDKKIIIRIKS